jgi:hypothetical protein
MCICFKIFETSKDPILEVTSQSEHKSSMVLCRGNFPCIMVLKANLKNRYAYASTLLPTINQVFF